MTLRKKLLLLTVIAPLVFLIDQLTKWLIILKLPYGDKIQLIPNIFDIVHITNRGAAFGFLANLPDSTRLPFFFIASTVALIMILIYFFTLKEGRRSPFVALALILGGALGNIYDRVFRGEVTDFISLHWYDKFANINFYCFHWRFGLEWPAFNVADMAISLSVIWLMTTIVFQRKN